MKKFKCQLVRSQYQTVEFEAEDYETAKAMAPEMFAEDGGWIEYIDTYDLEEMK